jgi:hypothetical protein
MITVSFGYPCDNKIQILKITKALDTLSCYLFRFTIQTQREQSSQCQRTLVRLLSLSVLGYLNITLASNQNNNGATTVTQGGVESSGSANLYPNTDIEGMGLATQNSTTEFVADKNISSASKIFPTQVDRLIYDSSSDLLTQDIKAFLAKPTLINFGTLTSTDTYSTFTGTRVPSTPLGTDVYERKIEGFLGFRATMVFRIVVNANRFQQGRYMLLYTPLGGADSSATKTNTWINDHHATLVQRTTMPHVEFDLCCDTEAVIKVPFNSVLNMYPFSSVRGLDWGIIQVAPYVPLAAAAGNLTASYSLFIHFEDVQMISAAIPQSGRVFTSVKGRKSDTEKEQDSIGVGPISSALIRVRDASSILSNVPLLSSYASGVSWFADIGASVAKVFGWSKPVVLAASTRMTQNYLPYIANTDGPDMSFPLSLSYENSVGVANGFSGTDVDEMDFKFLCTIPVWNQTVPWAISSTVDTLLIAYGVCPKNNAVTTVVNTTTFNHYSPLQFVAQHFNYWRGSLVYKFKFVKTEFHSGRLSISFNPHNVNVSSGFNPTNAQAAWLHREIIDIREANEFTFVVPYIADSPYRTNYTDAGPSITGNLVLRVLDPLVAPATVSQSISIIVEICAGPDIEFAVPAQAPLTYYTGLAPQSGNVFGSVDQGNSVCSNVNTTLGSSLIKSDGSLNSLHSIGEKISSFRALLKMPVQLIFTAAPVTANYLNIIPFAIDSGTVVGAVNTAPRISGDLYSRLASCYVYSRGGVRLKFVDNAAVTITTPLAVWLDTRNTATAGVRSATLTWSATNASGTSNATDRLGMPTMYYRAGYSGEVQIPQYARYHSRLNSECAASVAYPYSNFGADFSPDIAVTRNSLPLANVEATVYRSLSDDGNFGSFLSIPPMVFTVVTQV